MIPMGLETAVNRVILFTGVLNIGVAMYVARQFGPIGMAWCAVFAEVLVLLGLFVTLQLSGRGFWSMKKVST